MVTWVRSKLSVFSLQISFYANFISKINFGSCLLEQNRPKQWNMPSWEPGHEHPVTPSWMWSGGKSGLEIYNMYLIYTWWDEPGLPEHEGTGSWRPWTWNPRSSPVFVLKGFVTLSARPSCGQGWDPTPDTQDLKVIQVHEHRCGFWKTELHLLIGLLALQGS